MTSSGTIRWKALKGHLNALLPGWSERMTKHSRDISFEGKKFRLPKGAHGAENPEIELGHVRGMFRQFGKTSEAKKRIPQLR